MASLIERVARDNHRITTTDFAQDVIITPLLGGPVTVKAYAGKHTINVDELGVPKVNTTLCHITVSEKSLKDAGLTTRDISGRLITFVGWLVKWTDVSGFEKTYIVQKGGSKPNKTVGVLTFILGDYGAVTPPRVIYGWKDYVVYAKVVATLPDPVPTQTIGNGDVIPAEYVLNLNGTLTIPYLISVPGMQVLTPLMINNDSYQDIDNMYNTATGTFDVTEERGGFAVGNELSFNASLPIWNLLL